MGEVAGSSRNVFYGRKLRMMDYEAMTDTHEGINNSMLWLIDRWSCGTFGRYHESRTFRCFDRAFTLRAILFEQTRSSSVELFCRGRCALKYIERNGTEISCLCQTATRINYSLPDVKIPLCSQMGFLNTAFDQCSLQLSLITFHYIVFLQN